MLGIIISLAVFVSYIAYILIKYGIQRSISASWHDLTQGEKWMFTISTWGYTIPIVLTGLHGSEFQNILLIFAGFLLCIVGVMTNDQSDEEKKWHTIGAEGGILLGLIWCMTWPAWWIVPPVIVAIYFMAKLKVPHNHTWWIEHLAYFTILTCAALCIP